MARLLPRGGGALMANGVADYSSLEEWERAVDEKRRQWCAAFLVKAATGSWPEGMQKIEQDGEAFVTIPREIQ